jgi:hypothetical protein
MRKLFFILITLLFTTLANAQVLDSISIALPQFSDTASKLKSAKGWLLQNNGEWVSARNKIPHDNTVIPSKTEEYKFGKENFSSIELKLIKFKKKSYALLVVMSMDGYYEFPSLKSNWKTRKIASYFVFDKEILRSLIPDISMIGKPFSVNLNVYCSGIINLDKDKLGIENIVSEDIIKTNQGINKNTSNLIFSIYPIKKDDDEKVLFKFFRTYSKKALYEFYLQSGIQKELFGKSYYEADYDDFSDFITNCLNSKETFKQQSFSPTKAKETEEFKSNYNALKAQLNTFKTTHEDLKVDTTNFYAPVKISKFADTVAATSFKKPDKNSQKGNGKITTKVTIIDMDSLNNANQKASQMKTDSVSKTLIVTNSNKVDTVAKIAIQPIMNSIITYSEKVVLRVQIAGAAESNLEDFYRQKFSIAEKIYVIPNGLMYKYAVGEFDNFEDANQHKIQMQKDFGVTDAFLIAIKDGKLISLNEAKRLMK